MDATCVSACIVYGMSVCLCETESTRIRGAWMIEVLSVDRKWMEPDDPVHAYVRPVEWKVVSQPKCAERGPLFDASPVASGSFLRMGGDSFVIGPRSFLRWCSMLCAGTCPLLIPPTMCVYATIAVQVVRERMLHNFERLCSDFCDPRFMYSVLSSVRTPVDVPESRSPSHLVRRNCDVVLFIASMPSAGRQGAADLWVRFHLLCPQDYLLHSDELTKIARAKEIVDRCFIHTCK
jgi:hypothetical protein